MQKEWKTTDNNTIVDECDLCHYKRPVKKMLDPEYKDEDFDDYEPFDFEEIMFFYCFSCYQEAPKEKGF